LFKVIK